MMLRLIKSLIAAVALFGLANAAEDTRLEWKIQSYPAMTAKVGDTLTFFWNSGTHNVHINPDMNCASRGNAESLGDTSEVSYTFTDADAGTDVYFACFVGSHCNAGQHVTVTVEAAAAAAATDAPTPVPVTGDDTPTDMEPEMSGDSPSVEEPSDAASLIGYATGAATFMLAAALL